ncbi:MAG: SPOR domain-containing protein [Gemmatimonadales bacterium]
MRSTLLALVLVLAACGRADRRNDTITRTAPSTAALRGPDNLVLRIPRTGGTARVYAYPQLDTVVWSADGALAPDHVLAFDDEAGTVAYEDTRGNPARIDFRQGGTGVVSRAKLTSLASSDGSAIYAIDSDGSVQRFSGSGTWKWKPPLAARALFPQPDGTLLVLSERKNGSVLWHIHPPAAEITDSVEVPKVDRTLRTQVGDRLYLGAGRDLIGVRLRTMERTPTITLDAPVELMSATPSGDRVFVVIEGATAIQVMDRYREEISGRIELGRPIAAMRMDPLGRYLLVRPQKGDSALVIALGTNRVVGAVPTAWRTDLPFVGPDGGVALAQGKDVIIADGQTLRPTVRVRGGASDFWYAFRWTGFRPRDATLDVPVQFPVTGFDTTLLDSAVARDSAAGAGSSPGSTPSPHDTAQRRPPGFTVSFAALLVADKARDLAAKIQVGTETARVVTSTRDGAQIYRVVLGPYPTHEEADRIGRESHQSYWVYEGGP